MAKMIKKTLLFLIIACFVMQSTGISYALRPAAAKKTAFTIRQHISKSASAGLPPETNRLISLADQESDKQASLGKLKAYLENNELSNFHDAIVKVMYILNHYPQDGKRILLEIGGGNTDAAYKIADVNRDDMSVITFDLYDTEHPDYGESAEEFDNKSLTAQKSSIEDLAVIRADDRIFDFLPPNSIDYILLVSPVYLADKLKNTKLWGALKIGGEILVKPYWTFDYFNHDHGQLPQEVQYDGFLFKNTNSTVAFEVDIDDASANSSGEPIFICKKTAELHTTAQPTNSLINSLEVRIMINAAS